ncbi:MAG: LptF/LptG family permease [Terriglobales bacterium]
MRILTRYILREVVSHAAIGAAVFTFVFFMVDLEKILEVVVRNSAPLPTVLEVFAFTLPKTLTFTIPMAVLVGILIGLSRLAADSEITAMRSTGMGAWMFVRIIGLFVLGACGVALLNNLVIAPRSAVALADLQDRLKTSQASFEIQPRVFYEGIPNVVLYVQDVSSAEGAAVWKGVFLADIRTPSSPKVTLAREAVVINDSASRLQLHLINGSQHETDPKRPEQNVVSTFTERDVFVPVPSSTPLQQKSLVAPVSELGNAELLRLARLPKQFIEPSAFAIEFHRRLSMALAGMVLALVGIPLGLSSKRGGKSTGFVLTIALVFLYYLVFLAGMSFARQEKISPAMGVWMANVLFFLGGIVLLWRVERMPITIPSMKLTWSRLRQRARERRAVRRAPAIFPEAPSTARRRTLARGFPLILDDLILREFITYLALILSTFLLLMVVFTFFELLKDIVRTKASFLLVGAYLLNLVPFLIYNLAPLSVLLAVLVTFGLMQKQNEITAMKATGISVYRIIVPVLVLAAGIATGLFFFDQWYLPHANKRQDALRNQIKGKPPQTFLRPDRKWIFGEQNTIYYYEFFDADQNRFASFSAFEFDPHTFDLKKRVYALRVHWEEGLHKWVFQQGWERSSSGSAIVDYKTFDVATFPEIHEPPQYFKKEVKQSSEMSYKELRRYIHDLQQSGFDVVRLRVQLQKKFAFPLITFVMAVLAIPFSLSAGRRGALAGVATAIGIAVLYWVTSGLFEAMGNTAHLPAALAAWSPDVIFALAGGYLILKVPT